jgi:hypothetical protein
VKNDSRYEAMQADCAVRAKLWQKYVANYQKVLQESPEAFSARDACSVGPAVGSKGLAGYLTVRLVGS